jgi:hypothetical protein
VLIEKRMDTAVRGLLTHEALDFFFEMFLLRFGEVFQASANRVNEELFAHWKTHGQGIEKRRLESISATPIGGEGGAEINQQFSNKQLRHEKILWVLNL